MISHAHARRGRRPAVGCETGDPVCGRPGLLYACGWRCDAHAPWAVAGRPRPRPGPGWPAGAWRGPAGLGVWGWVSALRAQGGGDEELPARPPRGDKTNDGNDE